MSRVAVQGEGGDCCFPRVSGDEPDQAANAISINKFSPRERG